MGAPCVVGSLCGAVKLESMAKCLLSLCFCLTLNTLSPLSRRTKGCWILRTTGLVSKRLVRFSVSPVRLERDYLHYSSIISTLVLGTLTIEPFSSRTSRTLTMDSDSS